MSVLPICTSIGLIYIITTLIEEFGKAILIMTQRYSKDGKVKAAGRQFSVLKAVTEAESRLKPQTLWGQ